jgi:hypothetical protein
MCTEFNNGIKGSLSIFDTIKNHDNIMFTLWGFLQNFPYNALLAPGGKHRPFRGFSFPRTAEAALGVDLLIIFKKFRIVFLQPCFQYVSRIMPIDFDLSTIFPKSAISDNGPDLVFVRLLPFGIF